MSKENVVKIEEFQLDKYLAETAKQKQGKSYVIDITKDKYARFLEICEAVKSYFNLEWDEEAGGKGKGENFELILDRQKKAIIGHSQEVAYFKDKIEEYLRINNLKDTWYPNWYKALDEAIFSENWGFAGLVEWIDEGRLELKDSSSAKIIGERIYFLINGEQVLQPQTISYERRKQLKKALLLKTPKKRADDDYYEVYMLNGTRITIFAEGLSKPEQDSFVFRKYVIKDYTFERQAELGTIPVYAIPLFKNMIDIGFNTGFIGPVRTAKTTFLTTWQSYENPKLEGVMIETDPEIPIHILMPTAPIIQLVADGDELKRSIKSILRSDADYIVMAEARDSTAFYIASEVADRGTRRVKMTAHFSRAIDFPYNVASKICEGYGGDVYNTTIKVVKNFQYVFEFIQMPKNKSKKRLKGIYELRYDPLSHDISIHQICKYRFQSDDWVWKFDIGEDKREIGDEEDHEAFEMFETELKRLALAYPLEGEHIYKPAYNSIRKG